MGNLPSIHHSWQANAVMQIFSYILYIVLLEKKIHAMRPKPHDQFDEPSVCSSGAIKLLRLIYYLGVFLNVLVPLIH